MAVDSVDQKHSTVYAKIDQIEITERENEMALLNQDQKSVHTQINQLEMSKTDTKSKTLRSVVLKLIGVFFVTSCLTTPGLMSLMGEKANGRCEKHAVDYIKIPDTAPHSLPNGKTAYTTIDSVLITDGEITLSMSETVFSRIVTYLFKQLSHYEDRCSPWVTEKFYPNDIYAVDHCTCNGTFTLRIIDETDNSKKTHKFSTPLSPFSVDLFLKQFDDVRFV